MNKIATLTHEQEIDLLRKAQKGKTKQEREKAIRLLVYYNQSFVKYLVRGCYYPQTEINPQDLVSEGSMVLVEVIKNFKLEDAQKYRFATYAGYWVRQRIQSLIRKSQIFSQIPKKKDQNLQLDEEGKEVPGKKKGWGVVYYDRTYYDSEKDDKMISLLDTLADESENFEEKIKQRDKKNQINELISRLEGKDVLLVRLFFGIVPTNLAQLYSLASVKKKKDLDKIRGKKENILLISQKKNRLIQKYLEILSVSRKKEQVAQEINKLEFWDYFASFTELKKKAVSSQSRQKKQKLDNQIVSVEEKSKWLAQVINEKEIETWTNLGYQLEDVDDSQSYLLRNIGVSRYERDQWKKLGSKKKGKNWLEYRLEKSLENWRKDIFLKLKKIIESQKK